MTSSDDNSFYQTLPLLTRFEGVADASNYAPLPEGWLLAVADIVGSTKAIEEGRYKTVNLAGASVISALLNGTGARDYPFVFGGDGATVALPGHLADQAADILTAVRDWVLMELQLEMRVALVPIADIRAAGHDVLLARFAASDHATYAMFSGGGASWAEQQMKAGAYQLTTPSAFPPDLTGLSCRWDPIAAHHGTVLSIIAKPVSEARMAEFKALVEDIIATTIEAERQSHPLPEQGPGLSFSLSSLKAEAITVPPDRRLRKWLSAVTQVVLSIVLHRFNLSLGSFNARAYAREVAANSDFRKFDDGLKMTVDVDEERRRRIEAVLEAAEAAGICHYGIHQQDSALMTCFVLAPLSHDHLHFIDGGNGGYALAAQQLALKLTPDKAVSETMRGVGAHGPPLA
ncbi:DUF3095 domain-containing protein [Rhizobium sp. SSA_523]|uniref:DUF3095 domain-containing protein n=1 Tax=Rhizobium sp. SSA_523 TaxID=2952477 RepID=UPI002090B56E|nr:DUF3095 domain-containing protein [Rhizobium sp. SSA_523]MCO5732473.1 DUF3095 domain-containing protein [Rhizobium sp. SSA_523]WKC22385.1 DUF3095 domain-containing protein [Rhizobium sp. SSA_523]